MAWRFHGKVRNTDSSQGVCDYCSFYYLLCDLQFVYDYAGIGLINKQLRACPRCLDVPQPQLKTIILPADPESVRFPRPNSAVTEQMNGDNPTNWDAGGQWDGIGGFVWDYS